LIIKETIAAPEEIIFTVNILAKYSLIRIILTIIPTLPSII